MDLSSIPGRVIPKTLKMVLDASLLNTKQYKVRIKGKVEQSREGVAPSPALWCSSYGKGSLQLALDYGRQLYFIPDIGIMVRVFVNGPRDLGSVLGRVIPKTQKMVLHATLLNTYHCKDQG